jgi:hypothetical protein
LSTRAMQVPEGLNRDVSILDISLDNIDLLTWLPSTRLLCLLLAGSSPLVRPTLTVLGQTLRGTFFSLCCANPGRFWRRRMTQHALPLPPPSW